MVQFIPSAPGTTPYAPPKPGILEQIGPLLAGMGQAMGAPDANGNAGGVAAILQALHGQKTLNDMIGMKTNSAPITGPRGYTPPGSGPSAVPAGAVPPPPVSPFGPLGGIPMNQLKQLNDVMGKGGVAGILNSSTSTTLYMDPATGALSMVPSPGAIPIGGYKGPAAAAAVGHSKHQQIMDDHMAMKDKLTAAAADNSLSKEDKKIIAVARINAQALSNPLADFSDAEQAVMKENLQSAQKILSRGTGIDRPDPKKPISGTKGKKRVKVRGPNNETGTMNEGDALPEGWTLVSGN